MFGFYALSQAPLSSLAGGLKLGDAATSAAATVTASCVRVKDASCSISASATTSTACERVREQSSAVSATVTPAISYERVRESDAAPSVTSSTATIFRRVRLSASSVTSTSATVGAGQRVRESSAAPSASATLTSAATRVRESSANPQGTATVTANGNITLLAAVSGSVASTVSVTVVRKVWSGNIYRGYGLSSATCSGRKKWETQAESTTSNLWTTGFIPQQPSSIWTGTISGSTNTWT